MNGNALYVHALDACDDPDCELHNPHVGLEEGTVSEADLAFYVAGAKPLRDALQKIEEESFDPRARSLAVEALKANPLPSLPS